jgi:glycosyltransferase involved in cell wall biosynthesis
VNIGFVSTRLAGTDGVSLEAAKLSEILERMGHVVAYCAGELSSNGPPGVAVDEMHFHHPEIEAIHDAAFLGDESPALRRRITRSAGRLQQAIRGFVDEYDIALLVSQNASAIPMNIPLGVALSREIARTGMRCIGHHHDLPWERKRFRQCAVQELIDRHFPPSGPSIRHAVINTIARQQLRIRRGIESIVLPNVMDYSAEDPSRASRSHIVRSALGFGASDIVLLQPTRVVPRKGIELAVDLAHGLGEVLQPRAVRLLLTHHATDEGPAYLDRVSEAALDAGVDLVPAWDRFVDRRCHDDESEFDLRDAYECADLVTYPSLYEGFGNALLEAVFYRRPLLVNRYPVYVSDIGPAGFDFIEIEGRIEQRTIDHVASLLDQPQKIKAITDHNYEVARRSFSYEVAQDRLNELLDHWQ